MSLTDAKIRNTKAGDKPVKLADGQGLYLEIRPTGAKLWRYRYRIADKENLFALGEYAQPASGETEAEAHLRHQTDRLTLAEARTKRAECRALVVQGIHPAHHRQAKRLTLQADNANTFEAVAREWIDRKRPAWTNVYLRQVESFLQADVFPHIGKLPLRTVTAAHLLEIIRRVEGRGAETVALLIRQWCSAIFRYAVATLRADSDPAAALKGAIHRPKTEHNTPLTRPQVTQFLTTLESFGGYRTTVIALRLMLLTAVRTVELRGARWEELDLDAAEWRIPASRMKMRQPHIVPLSRQAVTLLRELRTYTGGRSFLFPNYRTPNQCMTATTLNRALERMGLNGKDSIGFSAHGFRGTFSTLLHELGYRPDVIERQLAHAERNSVRAAYNQAEYLEDRRTMMQAWADLCDSLAHKDGKVIPLRAKAA